MFFIILIYVILFRICLASPGESIDIQSDKDLNVPEQVGNIQTSNSYASLNDLVAANPPLNHVSISECGDIDSLNGTYNINLDRMHDFDNFDDAFADNSQLIEIPFGGIVPLVMRPNRSLDNDFIKPWVLQLYKADLVIKGCGPYHLLTKEDQKKIAHTLKTMINTHYDDLKWYEIVIVVDTYKCTMILKAKPEAPAHCRTYSKRVPVSGHLSRLMSA